MSALPRIGLRALVAAAKPGECPFCGEPKAKRTAPKGRHPMTCGEPECRAAYHRYYARDRNRPSNNAKRRARYAADPAFRARHLAAAKERRRRAAERAALSESDAFVHGDLISGFDSTEVDWP